MGNPHSHISSQLGRNPRGLWHDPLSQAAVQTPSTAPEETPGNSATTTEAAQAVVLPQTQRSLAKDARFFSDSAPTVEAFSFHTELATELKEIYRIVAVKGEKAEHAANAPAAEAMDHRHHVLRLWAEYQISHRVLKEDRSNGVDGYHLRTAMDLVADLAEKMPHLSSEESLELGVHLSRELTFLVQAEKNYALQNGSSEDSGTMVLAKSLEEVAVVLGQELAQSLERVESPTRRLSAMAEFQELRQAFSKNRPEQEGFAIPNFQGQMISLHESQLAAKEKLLGVEKEIARLTAGPERMLLRFQVLEGFLELGLKDEADKKLQSWARVAKSQDASPELMQEWIGISAALMQREIDVPASKQASGSVEGMNIAFAIWQKLPPQGQLAFAKTLNDLSVEMGRHGLDRQGDLFLNRQSMAGRLTKIASSPKLTWSAAEQVQLDLEAGRANGNVDLFLQVYENHWNDLNGAERLQLRQAHGAALLELKERFKNEDSKLKTIEEQAYVLAESWRLTVTEGQLSPEVEILAAEDVTMLELENLTELVMFCHGFGTGLNEQSGRVSLDSLGNHQEVEQSQAPLHLLERKLANYRQADRGAAQAISDPGQRALALANLNIEQNQLGGIIGSQLVEVWPYATVELLSKVSNVDLSSVASSEREKLMQDTQWLKAQLGLVSLYDRAKSLLRVELQTLATEQKRLSRSSHENDPIMRELLGQAKTNPQERARRLQAIPHQVNNATWALNSVSLWAEQGAEQVAEYSTGDLQAVARAMAHYEGGRYDDAVILFQNLMERESLDHPDAQTIVDSLGKSLLSLNQGRLDRQINLLKAFARAEDYPSAEAYQNAAKTGRRGRNERQVNRGLAELGIYLRSLPQDQAPTNLTVAIHRYLELHPESDAVKKLSDFIYQGPSSQSKHHREISSLLGAMDNLDSAADAQQALGELQILLDKDVDYWEGEGEMMMALYQASSQIQAHMPLGSEAARKVRYFESRIQTEEMSGQFYRELFSKENAAMLALTFVGAGVAAKAGQWAARAMRARLATQTAIGGVMTSAELEVVAAELVQMGRVSTVAEGELFLASRGLLAEVTTVDMAGMGISQGLKIAVLPEAANVGANAATFWAFNHITQPGAESHNLGATAIDVGMIHFAMKPFHSWGHLEGLTMRILGGASAMTAAGVLRTEIHEVLPGLHLAHEGEDPLSVYSFLHNVAFGAGMEAGGAAVGRRSSRSGHMKVKESPARQKNIQKIRQELASVGLKIEKDAQGNLNKDGEIFLQLASGHLKSSSFSFGRWMQMMKGGGYLQADSYLQKSGLDLRVSAKGKILSKDEFAAAKNHDGISDVELARLKKEIPRQMLDLINDELAQVGLSFLDLQGKLNANAKIFIELLKHHMHGSNGFSFGEFVSLLKNKGGHVASRYLSRTKVPYWVSPNGKVQSRGKRSGQDIRKAQIEELSKVLEEISDIEGDVLTDLDTSTNTPETEPVLDDLQLLFQEWNREQSKVANGDNYARPKGSHDLSTAKDTPVRVPTEKLVREKKTSADVVELSDPNAETAKISLEDRAGLPLAAGERRKVDTSSPAIALDGRNGISSNEAAFRLKQAEIYLRQVDSVFYRWVGAEDSIVPGSKHSSVKMKVETTEAPNGIPYLEAAIRVKGEHRAAALVKDLEKSVPMLKYLGTEKGSEVYQISFLHDGPMVRVKIVPEALPYDANHAAEIYQAFRKYFLPTLNAWFQQSGLRAGYAARTHAILDRFDHLWKKTDLNPQEQDAIMNLVEYLKEVPSMIRHTDVMDRVHQAEQVALRVGPEAYQKIQDQSDRALDLFGEVQRKLSLDELATGKVLPENQEIYQQYQKALSRLDGEIVALMQLPTGEGEIFGAAASQRSSLLDFSTQEVAIFKDLGVDSANNLVDPSGNGAKRYVLAYGLDRLLRMSQVRQDPRIDWGIMRLSGAIRQQLSRGQRSHASLDALLAKYQRNDLGMPLKNTAVAIGPQAFAFTGSQRNVLAEQFPAGEVPFGVDPSNVLEVLLALHQLARKGGGVGKGQQALRLKPMGQQVLTKIGEGYGPLIQKIHPELYQYYLSLNGNQRIGFDSGRVHFRALAGAWARLRDWVSRDADTSEISWDVLRGQLHEDILSLGKQRPNLQKEIKNLPRQFGELFERGATVEQRDGQNFLVEPSRGNQAIMTRPVGAEVQLAYLEWQKRRGFIETNVGQTEQALAEMRTGLGSLGVTVEIAPLDSETSPGLRGLSGQERGALVYLNEIFKQMPAHFWQSAQIKKIAIMTPRPGMHSGAHFDANTQTVYIYSDAFKGSRRNLAAVVLHEIGHGTARRFTTPHTEIPFEAQNRMALAHRVINLHEAHLGLDILDGPQARANYQRSLPEFLAELNLMYVAAGPKLRQHIQNIPRGSRERKAWEEVYAQVKTRIFGGLEFGSTRPEYAEIQAIDWDNAGSVRQGGFQSQGPAQKYGSYAAWTDPSKFYNPHKKAQPVNEDAVAQFSDGAIVADGMGGHGDGDKASAIVVQQFVNEMQAGGDMVSAFKNAATEVHRFNGEKGKAGAVAVAMKLHPQEGPTERLEVVHSGDAKLVVFLPDGRGGYQVGPQTFDHTLGGEMYRQGRFNTMQMRIDPQAHAVASALGAKIYDPIIEHQWFDLPRGAKVVMGSDGLWDNMTPKEVAQILNRPVAAETEVAQIKQTLDWKMEQFDRAKKALKAGRGHYLQVEEWNEFTHEMESVDIKVVPLADHSGMFISRQGNVYNAQGQVQDHFKVDNLAIYVYHHDIP